MNRIKKILSMVLVCAMVLALVPVTTLTVSAAATGTTALFNGNATYLLQERFATTAVLDGDATRILSGWDVDYRGGDITYDGGAMLIDSNAFEKITMSHQLMKHTGALVMESVFTFKTPVDEGFYYEMRGNGSTALKLETVRKAAGGAACVFAVNGVNTSITPAVATEYHLKAEFTGSKVTVWINGTKVADSVDYLESTTSLDEIEIGTSETGIGKIQIKNVYVYVNYTANENFLGTTLTGWDVANGEVVTVPGAPYSADTYGYALNSVEAVEPSYVVDDAKVRVVADEASELTWKGGTGVTVTDGATAGGRSNVIKATGLGDGNTTTAGVSLGTDFKFEAGDVLTYSVEVYSASTGTANIWLRRHTGNLEPFTSWGHSLPAGAWTTLTRTVAYEDFGGTGDWTQSGNFALYFRPTVSELYLDNFKVTVMKANGQYYTNATTGEYINWTETMDGPSGNVLCGSNMTSSYADGVLSATYTSGDSNNSIVAVKLVDNTGAAVTTLKAGDVIDVSVDVNSSSALSTTSGTAGIMLRGGSMSDGGNGPSSTDITQLGKLTASANTWTTQTASYGVTADMTTSGAWYIFLRPQQTGTLKVDNFKVSVRTPSKSIQAPTWEINTASDVTWKNGGTATDANGVGGRDNVVALGNLANANGNTAGIVLGNSFAFQEGDVLKYSFDAYSTAAIEPDLWLRNHGTSLNPFKQIDNPVLTANTWTTVTGSVDYATLIAAGAFNTPDKFALYFRPNTSGTIYIDNFKVEIANTNKYIVDLVDGSRVKYTASKASDLTFANGLASDDATKGAIQMNLNGSGDGTSVGIQFGKNFCFKQGDTFTYSYDIYTETADVYPDFWLRERGSYAAMRVFYNPALTTGTWTTVTGTMTYDELMAGQSTNPKAFDTVSNSWYAYIRLRNSKSATVWVKNFNVKVTQAAYAFGDQTSNASLKKNFSALSGNQTLSFDVFVPNDGANGFKATLGGATFKIADGKFYLGNTELYTPTNSVWYRIKVVTDGATASASVNGDEKASGVAASGAMTSVVFENTTGKQIKIDNVQVAPTYEASDFADYPVLDDTDIANAQTTVGELDLGMVSYPMWREGIHYGWDLITPYEDEREPYLGYYSGGSQEVADWNIKWWAEHGFDHVIYPFVRPAINEAGGQPSYSVRGEELHDGYMNAVYKDKVDFAIMLTNPLVEQFTDAEGNVTNAQEWIDNVLPYITETYFKHPNYKKVNNQLVIYNYNLQGFAECLTATNADGNVTQDGTAQVVTILSALNNKAKELGYGGIMFVMDTTSMKSNETNALITAINNAAAVATLYKWKYTWRTDVGANVSGGIQNEYQTANDVVASIPMGFESTPWTPSDVGFMDVSEIESICTTVKNYRTANDPSIVLFTCWDEWGEGHFFSPAQVNGFGYLNAARKILTDKAAAISTETPTEDAKKRMGVLYPEGRQMLKVREDKKEALDPSVFTNSLGTLTPSSSNFADRSGCNHNSLIGRDYKTYKVTDADQAAVWFDAPTGIDYSKVTAIKVRGYSETSASLVVKYGTDADDAFSDNTGREGSYANRYRFSCANVPGTTAQDFILLPNYPNKIAEAANENIKYIRFNPQTNTAKNTKFYIESITFYSDDIPGFDLTIDDEKKTVVSEAPEGLSATMLPAYKLLLDIGAKVTWDKAQKKLYATKDGITAIYQDGFRNVVDAADTSVILAQAPAGAGATYDKGNLFVSYDVLLAPFGYTVEYDPTTGNIDYYSEEYYQTYDTTDYRWDFNKDGDREGWTLAADDDRYFMEAGYAATVKEGVMHIRAAGTDCNLWLPTANITRANANFFSINLDTDATQLYLRLYDTGTYASGAGWTHIVNIPAVDGPQDIVIDLSQATDRDGKAFSTMGDTITKIRLDPIYGKTGSNYVDYIQFTKNHPNAYALKAYSFGDNIFTDYTAAYWQSSGTVNGNGWNTIQLTDEGDVKIQPAEGQGNGITGITWIKSGTGNDLASFVQGKIVRVSFDYKGVGDITKFRFENRDTAGSPGRDGEEFIVDVTSDWQHFDEYINVDEVTDGRRWFGIRAIRSDTTGDDYLVVRDWQIRVLNDSDEVNTFTDSGVAIKAINNTGTDLTNDKVHVGAFDVVNKVLTGFTSGNVPNMITINSNDSTKTEEAPYYFMAPTDATTEIRAFWWDNFDPLLEPLVLQKAN